MVPSEALAELRRIFGKDNTSNPPGSVALEGLFVRGGELFQQLDYWLSEYGERPGDWQPLTFGPRYRAVRDLIKPHRAIRLPGGDPDDAAILVAALADSLGGKVQSAVPLDGHGRPVGVRLVVMFGDVSTLEREPRTGRLPAIGRDDGEGHV